MNKPFAVWLCSCLMWGVMRAAYADNRTWNSIPNVSAQWSNATTWVEGAVPTANDDVFLNNSNTLMIASGVAAVAKTIALSNALANTYQVLYITNGASLTVGGAISDTGAGIADIKVYNTNADNAASVLVAASVACREFSIPSDAPGPQYLTSGYDMTLSSWINVNYGAPAYGCTYRQTNGVITIPNGGYGIVLMDANAKPTTDAFARFILDGGTLKSDRIGVADDNGNNSLDRYAGAGFFEFNNGTVQTRTTSDAVWFRNGYALENYPTSGVRDTQYNTSKPTTIQLSQSGTHTFYADGSGNKIYISPSAQVVDKPGEAGTLLKAGAGDLVFTGGGLAATNTWTGDTTVTNGRVQVDYSQVAGAPGSLVLVNAYSPASKLILNGGGFDLTGRSNAVGSVASGLTFSSGTLNLTVPSTVGLVVGQAVSNAYLPSGSYIRRINSGTQVQLNAMSTSTTNVTGQAFAFGAASFASEQTISNVALLASASTVSVNPAGTSTMLTFVNVSGTGAVTKAGVGSLRLIGAVAPDGKLNVSAGVLDFAGSANIALTNAITGSGTIRQSGSGTTTVVAASASLNSFSGAVVVDGGTLQQGVGTANQYRGFTSASSFTVNSNATLLVARDSMNGGATYNLNNATLKTSAGYQTLGRIYLNGGTIVTGPGSGSPYQAFALSGDIAVTGAVPSQILSGMGLNNGIHLTFNQSANDTMRTFKVDDTTGSADADLTISATLVDSSHQNKRAGLIKTGAGTLLLSAGTNTYSGATTVSNGTLLVSGGGITGSVVTVVSGATFGAAGTNVARVAGLTLNEGAKLAWTYDGDAHAAGRIDALGALTLPSTATLNISGTGFLYSDQTLLSAASITGATDLSGWTVTGAPSSAIVSVAISGSTLKLVVNRGTMVFVR